MSLTKTASYVVTASDGTFFRCHVDQVGADREDRWIFIDKAANVYVGPLWFRLAHVNELQELVNDWWGRQKST